MDEGEVRVRGRRGEICGKVFGRDREGGGNASGGSAVVCGGDSERGGSRGEDEESKGMGDERRGDGKGVSREIQGGNRRREAIEFVWVIGGIRGCDEL